MVFIMEGMSLRIPAGGLSISVDEAGNPTASLSAMHVAYEIWPHWLEIALDHAELYIHPPDINLLQHDVLGVGVEWRFAAFTAPNAVKAASLACDIIHHSIGVPWASLPTLEDWCELASTKIESAPIRASELSATASSGHLGRGGDSINRAGS